MQIRVPKRKGIGRKLVWGLAALCLAALQMRAQRFSFRDATEGLGDLNVNSIAQDRTGYLWVGTENGLYRYDGLQFRRFGAADGMRARTVRNVSVGPDGTLWVGTSSGVFFERQNGGFAEVRPPAPVDQFSVRYGSTFAALAPDRMALADQSGAFQLHKVAADDWVAEPMHLFGNRIWSVLARPGGELWYGCDRDLCRLSAGRTTQTHSALGVPEDRWSHLQLTVDGQIWMRGLTHLGEFDAKTGRYAAHEFSEPTRPVPYLALISDREGRIIASQGPSFGIWENGHWNMVTERNGLSHYDLSCLFVDREGSIWVGMVGHGLRRWLGRGRWESFTAAEGLSDDIVWASQRDGAGRLWIGTESGVNYLEAGGNTLKTWHGAGIEITRAMSLTESGAVWVGSAAGGLTRIDEKTLAGRHWDVPEVYRVLADDRHRVWTATASGLFQSNAMTGDSAPRVVLDPAFVNPQSRFTDLCLDAQHNLWAASDHGLYRLNASGWRRIDPGLAGVNPSLLAADKRGNLWVTGPSAGIMRLHIEGDRVVEAAHVARPPLLSEQVVSLIVDRRGWLWVGQDAGVSIFDGQTWRSYTQDDGLIWNDADTNGLTEDADGSIWVGTSNGISHLVDPRAEPASPPLPPVLTDVRFGVETLKNGARMEWSKNPLAISLSTLSFRDQQHIRFRYRLVGLESDWIETAETNVRYPQLEPGTYQFEAQAVDAATGATSPASSFSFRLVPLWWQSELFPLGFSLIAGAGVVVVVRWRVKLLQTQKLQLEQAIKRRTEDLEREKMELLDARDQLKHYAEHDGLTGLWNHRVILDRLRNEIDRAQREGTAIGLIIADVDHFKRINDTFGHRAGDLVLREIGEIFVRSVRSYDWVGRYGGEEYLLILPGSGFAGARNRAEVLRKAIESARFRHGENVIPVTASFGVVAGLPTSYETMIQAADAALYRAKDTGRNCVMGTELQPAEAYEPQWVRSGESLD